MLKKRLIFILLYQQENFYLSRNFQLQKVGNLQWLKQNYNFSLIAKSIDELIILDVSRSKTDIKKFTQVLKKVIKNCFIPVSVGGKINHLDVAKKYIDAGADKLVINSDLFNLNLIEKMATTYGEQSLIGSLDYKKKNKDFVFFTNNGSKQVEVNPNKIFSIVKNLHIGEVMLNSIDKDGTGFGLDFDLLKKVPKKFNKPIIYSGGSGNHIHILEGFRKKNLDAIATANLLNFVGDGLLFTRNELLKSGVKLAKW